MKGQTIDDTVCIFYISSSLTSARCPLMLLFVNYCPSSPLMLCCVPGCWIDKLDYFTF